MFVNLFKKMSEVVFQYSYKWLSFYSSTSIANIIQIRTRNILWMTLKHWNIFKQGSAKIPGTLKLKVQTKIPCAGNIFQMYRCKFLVDKIKW